VSRTAITRTLTLILLLVGAALGYAQDNPRPTLPPTWTPTFTPTATDTPTITPTPSITPTLTATEACERFQANTLIPEKRYYAYTDTFSLIFGTDIPAVTADFIAAHRVGTEAVGLFDIERVDINTINIPINVLPRHGLYDWSLALVDADERVLCERSGVFIAGFPVTHTPTTLPGPPTQTPFVIVVTATPSAPTPTAPPSIRELAATPAPPTATPRLAITPDGGD
jgi:hypothetical protein